jgi:hypothetical protein
MSSRNSNGLKEKNLGTSGPGGEHPLRAHQAYAFVAFVAGHPQAFHLYAEDPCTGEAAIMMYTDTKKDGHMMVEIHYNESHHEHTPRGGGLARVAGQSCLAGPSVLQLHPSFGERVEWQYGRESRPESQVFCVASRIFRVPRAVSLVGALFPPASFLTQSPHESQCTAPVVSVSVPSLQDTVSTHGIKINRLKKKSREECWEVAGRMQHAEHFDVLLDRSIEHEIVFKISHRHHAHVLQILA